MTRTVLSLGLAAGRSHHRRRAATRTLRRRRAAAQTGDAKDAAGGQTIAAGIDQNSRFFAAAKAAGLDATLGGPGPYTVLVADDAAFGKLPAGTADNWLKPESRAQLTGVLTNHILPGTILAEDIGKAIDNGKGKAVLATMGGGTLTATREGGNIVLTDARRHQGDRDQGRREAFERRRPPYRHGAGPGAARGGLACFPTARPFLLATAANARYKACDALNGAGSAMKATIERATLLKSLSHVQSVVERRNTIPILSNVLMEARDDGSLRVMATDLDLQVDESVAANVTQAGATTVSAHTLFDIIRKLPEGSQVELSAADGKMQVNAGRSRFNLSTLPRDDFPVIAEGELPTRFELPAATLRQIIDKTKFAISTEETRYYLMGIFLHVADDQLKAAATDGHRLARVTVPKPDGADGMPDVIIPRKCVGELRKLLDEVEGTVEVSLSPTKVRFGLGSAVLTSKLIDGTFPDYNRVIPTANDKLLKLDPKSFMQGVDRVSTIASEKTRAVKMSVDRDKVTLSVTSPENGLATEELPADYASDGIEIGFNARYLMDILHEIEGDSVEVHLADAAAPTLLRENDKSNALYVLMPMRV